MLGIFNGFLNFQGLHVLLYVISDLFCLDTLHVKYITETLPCM